MTAAATLTITGPTAAGKTHLRRTLARACRRLGYTPAGDGYVIDTAPAPAADSLFLRRADRPAPGDLIAVSLSGAAAAALRDRLAGGLAAALGFVVVAGTPAQVRPGDGGDRITLYRGRRAPLESRQ